MEYYEITQGKFEKGKFIQPKFPITDQGMLEMLASGIASPLGHEDRVYHPAWGTGIYARRGKDDYLHICDDFDTSG